MDLIIKPDYEQLSVAAADVVAEIITTDRNAILCLPTGRTPKGMYRELVRRYRSEGLDFSGIVFFNLDEYLGLPENHPQRFSSYLKRELFDHVNATATNIYPPDEHYEEAIKNAGGIDLLILGIGANGHIAFNEPGSALDSRTRTVDLADSTIEGMRESFDPGEIPRRALTMGIATIMEARRILCLVSGESKREILAQTLAEPVKSSLPATVLKTHANATFFVDESAAGGK